MLDASIRTVSYTHLDVYKRQAQGEVTERTDSHFPLRHDIQQKKSIKGKLCGLSTCLLYTSRCV